jgi:hypothetical protein
LDPALGRLLDAGRRRATGTQRRAMAGGRYPCSHPHKTSPLLSRIGELGQCAGAARHLTTSPEEMSQASCRNWALVATPHKSEPGCNACAQTSKRIRYRVTRRFPRVLARARSLISRPPILRLSQPSQRICGVSSFPEALRGRQLTAKRPGPAAVADNLWPSWPLSAGAPGHRLAETSRRLASGLNQGNGELLLLAVRRELLHHYGVRCGDSPELQPFTFTPTAPVAELPEFRL